MKKGKGLFVVIDNYTHASGSRTASVGHRIASKLRDFRALGYRVIGILDKAPEDSTEALRLDFEFDDLYTAGDIADSSFPDVAWSVARRYSLNVRSSMLTSANPDHAAWASSAGLRRFEPAKYLFG